jgi:hypothetical protein
MKKFLFLTGLLAFKLGSAQIGGMGTYQFLQVPTNARINALGGNAISTPDADINLVSINPSLLNEKNHKQIGANFINYFSDIKAGELNIGYHSDTLKTTFAAGIQYINYGNFVKTAPDGQVLGTFTAGEYNYHLSAARRYNQISYGATLKLIHSNLEVYQSYGIAADIGANWRSEDELILVTAVLGNIGTQISTYTNDNFENIPYNVQIGFSKKFAHNPFRFGIIAHNLQSPGKLLYQISNRQYTSLETGLPIEEDFSLLQKAMSHLIINTELLLGKTIQIRFGYNTLRNRELSLNNIRGMNGFSWGVGLKLNRFHFAYGYGGFIPGRNTNSFSLITRIQDFKRAKN